MPKMPAWVKSVVPSQRGHFWAPDIIFHEGRHQWTDHGMVLQTGRGDDYNAIDPGHANVFEEQGKFWFSCHFYDGTNRGRPRLAIMALRWDQAGWPVLVLD